jgi:ABC-type nitrate/sulfonate/bicarbonate transport system substrate-binding protein
MRARWIIGLLWLLCPVATGAAEKVRYAYPAKSLNYLPLFLGKEKGIYAGEGIDLELVLVTSRIQVTALTTGDLGDGQDRQERGDPAVARGRFALAQGSSERVIS